jgi:hypothetical protein
MRYLLLVIALLLGCSSKKDNETLTPSRIEALDKRAERYCEQSKKLYLDYDETADPNCDAALFTALHGLKCDYVSVDQFESKDEPGKLCRRPGCTCWDNRVEGSPKSHSGFSKDQAAGMQLYLATYPDKSLVDRIVDYGKENNWVVCDADTQGGLLGSCLMSAKLITRWGDLAGKDPGSSSLTSKQTETSAHVLVMTILAENQIYGAISNKSLKHLRTQAAREPNNLVYQAALSRFSDSPQADDVARRLLEFFPEDLPTTDDYCTPYLYQRDEIRDGEVNPDWLPCKGERTHMGTDFLVADWVLTDL